MRYMMLIYTPESATEGSPEEYAKYEAFGKEVTEKGLIRAGDPLQSVATAKTVRVRNGGAANVTDGPFAETKEQLAGYYILDCKDMDEALVYAAKIPGATHGSIEVRPIMDMG